MRFGFVVVVILIGQLTARITHAMSCSESFAQLGPSATVSSADFQKLEKELLRPVQTIKALAISSKKIKRIVKFYDGGVTRAAALEVETDDGIKFLKIYGESQLESGAYTQVLQNAFARKGMAPIIRGYVAPAEVHELIARLPELRKRLKGAETSYAVLMDRIEAVANISKDVTGKVPASMSKAALEKRVSEFEAAMKAYRVIPPSELQAMIDKDGRFLLYDFDGYGHVTADDLVFNTATRESLRGEMPLDDFLEQHYQDDLDWAEDHPLDIFRVDAHGNFQVHLGGLRHVLGLAHQ